MNNIQRTNRCTLRLLVLRGSALLIGAVLFFPNEPILAADAGGAETASGAPR
jgi:hypothetical protein